RFWLRSLVTWASGPCSVGSVLQATSLASLLLALHGPEARVTVLLLVHTLFHQTCSPTYTGRAARQVYQRRNLFRANPIGGSESTKKMFRGGCFPKSARRAPAA